MAVAPDAQGTPQGANATTSLNDNSLTIGAGLTNGALLVCIAWLTTPTGTPGATTVTWNGTALTQIGSRFSITSGHTGSLDLWGLVNPAAGNHTLAISWTTPSYIVECASSWSGVNQTSPFTNPTSNSGTSTADTVTITSSVGDYVLAIHNDFTGTQAVLPILNATTLYNTSAYPRISGANYASQATTTTLTATWNSSTLWTVLGCNISGAAGAPATTPFVQPLVYM